MRKTKKTVAFGAEESVVIVVMTKINELPFELLHPHASYLPGLAHSDYFLSKT